MKKSHNRKKIYIIGCIILVVLVFSISRYYYISTRSKSREVFISTIDKIFEKIALQDNLSSISGNIGIKSDFYSDDESIGNMLDIVNNLDANIKYEVDYNTNKLNIISSTRYNQDELININSYIENKELYINLMDIYDKTIVIPIKKYNNYISALFNQNEIKTVAKYLNKAINNSLKDEYFIKKNTNISINGNDTKVTKNTLTLNSTNLNKIINDIKMELSNNDEFLNSLSQILNQTTEEIKSKIESINNNLEEIVTISLYTKKNDVIGFEIVKTSNARLTLLILKNSENDYSCEIKDSINSYKGNLEIKKSDNSIKFKISSDGKINGTINIDINYEKNKYINELIKNEIVEIENITDEERIEMFDRMQKKTSIRSLIKSLWKLIGL